uniref:Nudix hydrolase domain-containing protein n=1 Tax=Kalanchoe fedtschenkoi TaxID=63787 RepID=A0A7N0UE00_KALFE
MSGLNRSSSAPSKDGLPPQELLDDLCSRFVLNVPKEDQQSFERILFLVEYAHWFYEDNAVENNPSLKSFSFKEFTSLMFNSCDVLKPYVPHIDDIFKDFNTYKFRVPVTGAIILDETFERCVLVKGWKGTSWSFPRGKKSKDEEDHACAVREVLEETGFDISNLLDKNEYLEVKFGDQRVRLFIVSGVKDDTVFAPQTKKEISEIAWQRLADLQPASNEIISRSVTGLKLYMVAPFLGSLKAWISRHQPPKPPNKSLPARGISVWKARNNSGGNSSNNSEMQSAKSIAESHPVESGNARKLQAPKLAADLRQVQTCLSTSFNSFKFDTIPILQAVDRAFSS